MRTLPFLCLFPLFFACGTGESLRETEAHPFFDLRGYVDAQIDSLTEGRVGVEKTIRLNGVEETHHIADLNFSNDLRLFREADINRPAWFDKYDTVCDARGEVRYVSRDSSLRTQSLTINRNPDGGIKLLIIERKTGTVLSDGRHRLEYRPAEGYSLRTIQENRFGRNVDADVRVRFLQ